MTETISRVISITHFHIILGPVLIHTHWPYTNDSFLEHFCAGVIGFITVPLYYFVAGYLFFQNYENTEACYTLKIKKRIQALLIPYLAWNLIAFFVYSYFQKTMVPTQFLESFWVVSTKGGHSPADGPLWFIRTLMLLMTFAPVFYYIARHKYAKFIVATLLLSWLLCLPGTSSGTVTGGYFICWEHTLLLMGLIIRRGNFVNINMQYGESFYY